MDHQAVTHRIVRYAVDIHKRSVNAGSLDDKSNHEKEPISISMIVIHKVRDLPAGFDNIHIFLYPWAFRAFYIYQVPVDTFGFGFEGVRVRKKIPNLELGWNGETPVLQIYLKRNAVKHFTLGAIAYETRNADDCVQRVKTPSNRTVLSPKN
ncbi:anaerobic glycerol-3-phosphate dehydrogenase subunit C [Striga asiatica]|uniref:Anaerobic glycerol-3-phosphate dehydrogenase subunit C n=1 Tax=Striga asiatica TaxID=4170 RepID=A0A5A7RH86_STRAF|nr:anaerobic glycerol-3-phosphate dehydrogenase subunit C [Striga asiatica]